MVAIKELGFVKPVDLPYGLFLLEQQIFKNYYGCPDKYEDFLRKFKEHDVACFCMHDNGTIFGARIIVKITENHVHGYCIAIAEEYRGKGYAKVLMKKNIDFLTRNRIKYMTSFTMIPDVIFNLYKTSGLVVVGLEEMIEEEVKLFKNLNNYFKRDLAPARILPRYYKLKNGRSLDGYFVACKIV